MEGISHWDSSSQSSSSPSHTNPHNPHHNQNHALAYNNTSMGGSSNDPSSHHDHPNFTFGAQSSASNSTHCSIASVSPPRSVTSGSASPPLDKNGNVFSKMMRERQAKGKNPYGDNVDGGDDDYDDDDDDDHGGDHGGDGDDEWSYDDGYLANPEIRDGFEASERRLHAAAVLGNPELLLMYAQSFNDSVTGTKLYFTRMLCGFDDEDDPRIQGPKPLPRRSSGMPAPPADVQRSAGKHTRMANAQR